MCLKHELLIYYNFPIAQLRRVVYIQIAHDTGGKELNMSEISIAENTQLQTIRDLSIATFRQTFAGTNTEEDMRDYIAHGLSPRCWARSWQTRCRRFSSQRWMVCRQGI